MKKEVFFILFVTSSFGVCGYVPEERLFGSAESSGQIMSISQEDAFYREVVQNKKPVVAKVFTGVEDRYSQAVYREVADRFRDGVVFTKMKIADVMGVVRQIMVQLGISQVSLPLFLFFKQGSLILPVVAGALTKESLVAQVKKKFFSSHVRLKTIPFDNRRKREKQFGDFGEKLHSWLLSWQNIAREVKAYQLSRTRKRRKYL